MSSGVTKCLTKIELTIFTMGVLRILEEAFSGEGVRIAVHHTNISEILQAQGRAVHSVITNTADELKPKQKLKKKFVRCFN